MSPQRGGDREFFHRLAPSEECFDLLACVGLRRFGQMQVDHGGRQRRVTHVLLNRFDRHARFQKMRPIGVSQRVDADLLAEVDLPRDQFHGALSSGFAHG